MGLVSMILGAPVVAPVRGVVALSQVIQDRVNQELYDPASARQELEAAEEARKAGEISPEEEAEIQQAIVDRMTQPAQPGADER